MKVGSCKQEEVAIETEGNGALRTDLKRQAVIDPIKDSCGIVSKTVNGFQWMTCNSTATNKLYCGVRLVLWLILSIGDGVLFKPRAVGPCIFETFGNWTDPDSDVFKGTLLLSSHNGRGIA